MLTLWKSQLGRYRCRGLFALDALDCKCMTAFYLIKVGLIERKQYQTLTIAENAGDAGVAVNKFKTKNEATLWAK